MIAPVPAFSDSPAGKLPAETLNVYEPLPSAALTVCEYATPTVPFGSVPGLTATPVFVVTE